MSVLSAIFWGVIVLSLLVLVHEGGHFLAARAFGVRVTEFFLGMPSRWRLSWTSRRYGTVFGVTPLLLGGYNRICGMEGSGGPHLAEVLAEVQRLGRVRIEDVAEAVGIDTDEAAADLELLAGWGSVAAYAGEFGVDTKPLAATDIFDATWFGTLTRDGAGRCAYDREHDFSLAGTTGEGEPRPVEDAQAFLADERSHVYEGKGFIQRVIILLAGPAINILLSFVMVTAFFMATPYEMVVDTNVLGDVVEGGLAWDAGIRAGDALTEIAGTSCASWTDVYNALGEVLEQGEDFEVVYERDGQTFTTTIDIPEGGADVIGVKASVETYRAGFVESAQAALAYGSYVARTVARLLIPQHAAEIVSQSSSVVGISVMASEAASAGLSDLLMLMAAISMSLGFMNLLPVLPLDGGRIVVELIQLVSGRPLSLKAQNALTYIGLALIMVLFVAALRNDLLHIFAG